MNPVKLKKLINDPYNYVSGLTPDKIAKILKYLSDFYYNSGKSLVPDVTYDMIKDLLEEKNPDHPFLKIVGAPIKKDKVPLPFPMASLDKIKPNTDILDNWKKEYIGPYSLSDKLDGVSALLYMHGTRLKMYTRGDGMKGQDISYLIPYVIKSHKIPKNTAVRGELIISKKNFETIKDKMANGRNAVAGLVNSKTVRKYIANITEFVAYSIVYPRFKHHDQMKKIKLFGLTVVNNKLCKDITNNKLSELLIKRRKESVYEIDGIVVIDSSSAYELAEKNPKHGFAFKQVLTDQVAEVTVLDVLWSTSKDGYIKPRIKIQPINLVGVTITYATAFNAKFVSDNKLGPGATVKLVRSGDVIPHIMKVLTPATSGKPKMPKISYKWNKTKVDIIVRDIHGSQKDVMVVKKMRHFFKTLSIKYLDEGILTLLVKNNINTIRKIITANENDFSCISGLGKKIYKNIQDEITKGIKNAKLETFMSASQKFGRGFGVRRIRMILKKYPDILNKKWSEEDTLEKVLDIKGFDEITAKQFANGLSNFKKFYKSINEVIDLTHITKIVKKKKSLNKFVGQTVVFTGFRDKKLEEYIENEGGKVSSTVSSNTTLIVYADDSKMNGSKLKKGTKLGVTLMKKSVFMKKYKPY
jgi:DNA ligase (NAD+)